MPTRKVPISFVILTRNEELNIRATIDSVIEWADQVFVLDSYSDDRTLEIAAQMDVQIEQRKFDNFSAHKNWALDNLPMRNEWVFCLDADERLTHALWDEIDAALNDPSSFCAGFYIARKNHFMGKWIRHAGMFPDWQLRLFKRRLGRYEDRIVHEHVLLTGSAGYLKNALEHDDFKSLERWFDRHNVYTSMEAEEILRLAHTRNSSRLKPRLRAQGPERTRMIKELAYRYLPGRAVLVFIWMYLLRGGLFDGRVGFRYCVLKAFVDYQTSLKVLELQASSTVQKLQKSAISNGEGVSTTNLSEESSEGPVSADNRRT